MRPNAIVPFKKNIKNFLYNYISKTSKFYARIQIAIKQAEDAINLPLFDRLKKYSFIQRYSKPLKRLPSKKHHRDEKDNKKQKKNKKDKSDMQKMKENEESDDEDGTKKGKKRTNLDLAEKERKKFKRIRTISSMGDSNDAIFDILEELHWKDTENLELDDILDI